MQQRVGIACVSWANYPSVLLMDIAAHLMQTRIMMNLLQICWREFRQHRHICPRHDEAQYFSPIALVVMSASPANAGYSSATCRAQRNKSCWTVLYHRDQTPVHGAASARKTPLCAFQQQQVQVAEATA
jgi:ABC-type taurine transport system ATPase subunit